MYARRLIRKAFGRLRISGVLPPASAGLPVIAYMNHSAWWDAVIPVHLSHDLFRREIHALMEAEQIRRYPFFRHLGCFGPTESSIDEARSVAAYAARVLRNGKSSILWICPQGALLPSRVPLAFKSGLARIAHAVPHALIIPVAFRYEFLKNQKPDCWIKIGEPVVRAEESIPQLTRRLETRLQREIDALDDEILLEATRSS
ncbi:MAG: lysophospholipid acyltransferase family protein [Gemmatimonadales bacterium]